MKELKLLVYNLQDFFIFLPDDFTASKGLDELEEVTWQKHATSIKGNKPLVKVKEIADIIKRNSPDIALLTEVGGEESLRWLNQLFLNNQYHVVHHPSHSDRGIDIGYLVHRDFPYKYQCFPIKKQRLADKSLPSRGFLQLSIYCKPKLDIFLTHLKSKLDLKANDFEGRTKRELEVSFLLKSLKKNQYRRTIIAGDLNGVIYKDQTEEELKPLIEEASLTDCLEYLNIPLKERTTYSYFKSGHDQIDMQLDYILVSSDLKDNVIQAHTVKYLDRDGKSVAIPHSRKERDFLASDHLPILCKIRL